MELDRKLRHAAAIVDRLWVVLNGGFVILAWA
jgi:hypothetical protein